jgi:protein-L-isoaspartate(D-aspartate) O-methyltransferase
VIFARRALDEFAERYARPRADRWSPVPEALDRAIAADRALAEAARAARQEMVREVAARLDDLVPPEETARFAEALVAVPRERFVLPEEIGASAVDAPSPLDARGLATVSAPHAYVLSYWLLDLGPGDHLIELGTGTGYGAAIAGRMVGAAGKVSSIEIDAALHERAARVLADPEARGPAPLELYLGDARGLAPAIVAGAAREGRALRITVTYAIAEPPEALLAQLPEGGCLVAPVGSAEDQRLLRFTREGGAVRQGAHGAVRYVAERG